jgi:hypothetical protein
MEPEAVQRLIGDPHLVEQGTIPIGSSVGLQDLFIYKIAPGDPYLQWRYKIGDRHYYLWFARPSKNEKWRFSASVNWPSIVDSITSK